MTADILPILNEFGRAGFSRAQFQTLDGIFIRAVERGVLRHRTVDCDFDVGELSFCYCMSPQHPPLLTFMIKKVGPKTVMYELYHAQKGRIGRSALFDRIAGQLTEEIEKIQN